MSGGGKDPRQPMMKVWWSAVAALFAAGIAFLLWPRAVAAPVPTAAAAAAAAVPTGAAAASCGVGDEAGLQPPVVGTDRREVTPAVTAEPGLQATSPWTLQVKVIDCDSQPVEDARVEVFGGDWTMNGTAADGTLVDLGRADGPPLHTAVTDAAGLAALTLTRRAVYVGARHAAFGQSLAQRVESADEVRAKHVTLLLARAVEVRGTVVDANLHAVPFTTVAVGANRRVRRGMASDASVDLAMTDARGRFRFEAMAFAPIWLRAVAAGDDAPCVHLVATAGLDVLVPFPGAVTITGIVLDAEGAPVPDARVEATAAGGDRAAAWRAESWPQALYEDRVLASTSTSAASDGSFTLMMGELGDYQVSARFGIHFTQVSPPVPCTLSRQAPRARVDLRFEPMVAIRGVVCRADGAAVPSAVVRACQVGGEWSSNPQECGTLRVVADVDGHFAVPTPPRRQWCLAVAGEFGEALRSPVASASEGVELVLRDDPPASLYGEVVRDGDERPVTWFDLQWDLEGRGLAVTLPEMTAAGNCFTVPIPAVDGLRVLVRAEIDGPVVAVLGPLSRRGGDQRAVVRLPVPAAITVRLVDGGGQGLRGLLVTASHAGRAPEVEGRIDADGRATLRVVPGTVRFAVTRGYETLCAREVVVTSGANPELVLQVTL